MNNSIDGNNLNVQVVITSEHLMSMEPGQINTLFQGISDVFYASKGDLVSDTSDDISFSAPISPSEYSEAKEILDAYLDVTGDEAFGD